MSSENPFADAAEGVTKGIIKVSAEEIKQLIERFQNKDIAFVEDPEVINIAREQRKTSEWNLFRDYTTDRDLHILFQMGLTLRKVERQQERVLALRNRIKDKYGTKGLHIAQLVQNGFFNRFLAIALERAPTTQQLKLEINNLLENIENTVVFVKETDNVDYRTREITTKLFANSPSTFIIISSGFAMGKYREIETVLKGLIRTRAINYEYEHYEGKFKRALFLNKLEE